MKAHHFETTWNNKELLNEWSNDCEETFGNCRWMKMWHDHQVSKDRKIFNVLLERIEQLENEVKSLNLRFERGESEDKPQTLGGEVTER